MIQTRQRLHEKDLLAAEPLGRRILELRLEQENLLDTVWLATSEAQIKQLWSQVNEMLRSATDQLAATCLVARFLFRTTQRSHPLGRPEDHRSTGGLAFRHSIRIFLPFFRIDSSVTATGGPRVRLSERKWWTAHDIFVTSGGPSVTKRRSDACGWPPINACHDTSFVRWLSAACVALQSTCFKEVLENKGKTASGRDQFRRPMHYFAFWQGRVPTYSSVNRRAFRRASGLACPAARK